MVEWWYDDSGTNMLKGVDGDPDNPILLDDNFIVNFLSTIQASLDSFNRVVPNMLPDEQARLWPFLTGLPKYNYADPLVFSDGLQNRWNRSGVRTAGPGGGGGSFPR